MRASWSRRYYRLLLWLYPAEFRRAHARDLEEAFQASLRVYATQYGWPGVPRAWARVLVDTVVHAIAQRRDPRRALASNSTVPNQSRRHMVSHVLRDVRHAGRGLRKRPGFAIAVLLTVGFAVGANTAVFSVVHAVLLRSLPFHEPAALVALDARAHTGYLISLSIPNYMDWSERNRSFESFGAAAGWGMTLTGRDRPELVGVELVLGDLFRTLGVDPMLGATFSDAQTRPGAEPIAVLSHAFWQRSFGGDPAVIGQTLRLDDRIYTVVGVMPTTFVFPPSGTDVFVPMGVMAPELPWDDRTSAFGTEAFARLAPGQTLETARADMLRIGAELRAEFGNTVALPEVHSFSDDYIGNIGRPIWILLGAVGFVLLIAVANVANLLLVRGEDRLAEIAVRTALGATRGVVLRQLVTEGIVLSFAGGLVGVGLAYGLVGVLVPLLPDNVPLVLAERIGINGSVLLFSLGLCVFAGLTFGILPGLRVSGQAPLNELRGANRATDARGRRMRSALVVSEVALATVLLVGAGLMVQSLTRLRNVDKGFSAENVLTARTTTAFPDRASWRGFYTRLLTRAQALPGVKSAALTLLVPLSHRSWEFRILPEGVPWEDERALSVLFNYASADYFETFEIPILKGRALSDTDRPETEQVVVIDETMADLFWPGEDPIGKRVTFDLARGSTPEKPVRLYRTVVGVASNVRHYELASPSRIQVYVPFTQTRRWGQTLSIALKATVPPTTLVAPLRRELNQIDPQAPLYAVRALTDYVATELSDSKTVGSVLLFFGGAALLLAAMGIFAVMSYSVARRTREIGLRIALGARGLDVVRWITRQGLVVSLVGVVLGLGAAAALSRLLTSLLYQVDPLDPVLYLGFAVGLVLVGVLAAYLPARRAARIDPLSALRSD